jgi:hypothetical protein
MLCNLSKMKSSAASDAEAPLFDAAQIKGILATRKFHSVPLKQ